MDFCGDEVDGDPWRWTPEIVRRFLLDGPACRAVLRGTCSVDQLAAMLPAWVHHAARHRTVNGNAAEDTVATIDEAWPRFRQMLVNAYRRLSEEDYYPRYQEEYAW